jgi:hypothetical protein
MDKKIIKTYNSKPTEGVQAGSAPGRLSLLQNEGVVR